MSSSTKLTLVVLLLFAVVFVVQRLAAANRTSPADAVRLVKEGAKLVDVRTTSEFAAGHIAGAVNIPVQDLERRAGELGPTDTRIVLYCRSGTRSGRAHRILTGKGFTAVHDLGPMSAWPAR